jgi:hypothetical protein
LPLFRFVRSEKYVRKGLLRLCVAAGITWIGWLGYKSLDALADGSGWDDLSSGEFAEIENMTAEAERAAVTVESLIDEAEQARRGAAAG